MTLPNLLTIIRFLIIPPFLWSYLTATDFRQYLLAAGLLLLSGITDVLDGFLARKLHQVSRLGIVLDPFADKLTLAAVVTALWIEKPQWYPIYILLILKELLMGIGGLVLVTNKREITPSKWFGKVTTVLFYAITVLIIAWPEIPTTVVTVLLCVLLLWAVFALANYISVFAKLIRNGKTDEKTD